MYHYLKHAFLVALMPFFAMLVVVAPHMALLGPLVLAVFQMLVDMLTPDDKSVPEYRMPWLLDSYLYLHLLVSLFSLGMLLWIATPGDLWGLGQWLHSQFNIAVAPESDHGSWSALVPSALAVGFLISSNTLVGHELVHRTTDRFAMLAGRWILGLIGDAQFAISHVYGHHANVATLNDPATARRGENLYTFTLRSTIGQYQEAWKMENHRLQDKTWFVRILTNKVMTGIYMTALVAIVFYINGGVRGLAGYALVVTMTKFIFESVNYIEHYGLVRVPGTPVEPRHSWDCSTRASSNIYLNLSRHSHHHADARVKYWALKPVDGTPVLPYGYMAHMFLSTIPPLWHRFALPWLEVWDGKLASPRERELAADANRNSGHRLFTNSINKRYLRPST